MRLKFGAPAEAAALGGVEAATLACDGSPPITHVTFRRAVPLTPADRTGARVDYFPVHTAFPAFRPGRHPRYGFRGLLRLHSRYGPLDRWTARSGLCHEASACPVGPSKPLVSYQINRQLSGRNPPPLVTRAFGAHQNEPNFSSFLQYLAPARFSRRAPPRRVERGCCLMPPTERMMTLEA